MYLARKSLTQMSRRFSTSRVAAALDSYAAVNEPILGYEKGSKERLELEDRLAFWGSKTHEVPLVIGDQDIKSDDVRYQVRPFDHQNKLAKFYNADAKLLNKAIDASQDAHRDWERKSVQERAEIFIKAGDLIAGKYRMDLLAATMLGQGKTIIQAEIDTACELADFYRFNAKWVLELNKWSPISTDISNNQMQLRSLEGFWGAVAPFNFTAISGHLVGAPAMMGNVVLWKPSSTGVLSSYICFRLLQEAGVPPGVINFVPSTGPVFGDTVTAHPLLTGINFTGSVGTFNSVWTKVGHNIDMYRSYPRLIGECGGKNFHFVHPSADLDSVVFGSIRSAFEYGGQKCSACARMYVPESKWPYIRDKLVEEINKVKVGSPLEADTFFSAVIDGKAYTRIKGYLDHAKSSPNLTILAGGTCDDSKGYFVQPTLVQSTDPHDKIMEEEIFGPILSVYVYKDAEYKETLSLIDSTSPFALTGSIYAEDPAALEYCDDQLRFTAGNFYVNDRSTGSVVSQQPFGGARKSGTNDKAGGPHYLLRFTSPRSVKTTNTPVRGWEYPYMKS